MNRSIINSRDINYDKLHNPDEIYPIGIEAPVDAILYRSFFTSCKSRKLIISLITDTNDSVYPIEFAFQIYYLRPMPSTIIAGASMPRIDLSVVAGLSTLMAGRRISILNNIDENNFFTLEQPTKIGWEILFQFGMDTTIGHVPLWGAGTWKGYVQLSWYED